MGKARIRKDRKPGRARKPDPQPARAIKLRVTPEGLAALRAEINSVQAATRAAAPAPLTEIAGLLREIRDELIRHRPAPRP